MVDGGVSGFIGLGGSFSLLFRAGFFTIYCTISQAVFLARSHGVGNQLQYLGGGEGPLSTIFFSLAK